MIRRVALFAAALGLSVFGSQYVWAQQAPKGPPVKVDGTVDNVVVGQGIAFTGKDGKKYGIAFPPNAKVTLSGNAAPEFLKAGQYLQFTVTMDAKMKPTSDASKIQIVELSDVSKPGVQSEKGPDGKKGEPGPFQVRGHVKTYKDGMLTVAPGGPTVTVKVPDGTTIPVTIADWDLANPGDQISGDAFGLPAGQVAQGAPFTPVFAERIEIKTSVPITGKRAKKGK